MKDKGEHYRFTYRAKITDEQAVDGYVDIKLDPFRIASIYGLNFSRATVLKKILVAGGRGAKGYREDIEDCICALERELEMIEEDL
jgi:hypothetical protein